MTASSNPIESLQETAAGVPSLRWRGFALPFAERRALLFTGDLLLLVGTGLFALGSVARVRGEFHFLWNSHRGEALWLVAVGLTWLVLAAVNECYDLKVANHAPWISRALAVTLVETAVLYLVLFFILGRPVDLAGLFAGEGPGPLARSIPPRVLPVLFLALSQSWITLWRFGYIRLFTSHPLRQRAIIVGAGRSGRALVRSIREALRDYEIVGFIDDDPSKQGRSVEGLPVLGNRNELWRQVRAHGVNEIVLAIQHEIHGDLFRALMACYERGIIIKPMPLVYEQALGRVPVEYLRRKWFPVPPWSATSLPTFYQAFKRLMDAGLAVVGLAFLVPLLPFLALAIYVDSPGPIFYRQERLGKGGRHFWVIKFRSMVPDAEKRGQAVWARRGDPRITRVGHFLRRMRLDELPQLVNVLKGEMSIVGPRPERPEFVEELQNEIPFYRARLSVKPGLTGWAQINYGYGNTTEDSLIKLQYDLYYIKHQSLLLDLLIMLRTIRVMLAFRGT